jgi:flagellar hook-associated protein 2
VGISSSVGLGSGLNISDMVSQLVASERSGPSLIINRKEARAKAQISAMGSLSSAFSALRTALNGLKNPALFDNRVLTSSDSTRLTVRATGSPAAALGSIEVEVETLAAGQKLRSAAVADANAAIGTGTLSITADGRTFEVVVGESNNSLRGLANTINAQSAGKGVQASIVHGDDGYNLVLSAVKTGLAGTVSISQVGGSNLAAYTDAELFQVTAAVDAVFHIDGLTRTSSTNVVTDAVQGLELTLVKAELSEKVTVSVAQDSGGARRAVEAFVSAYNGAITAMATVSAYNAETNVAAALNGDAMVRGASQQLRTQMGAALTELAKSGIALGLDTELDGKLKFDAPKFNASYAATPGAVEALFSGEAGAIFSRLNPVVQRLSAADGSFARRTDQLNATVKQTTEQRAALDRRMAVVEERYRTRFIALDAMLGKLNGTSQYLAQQLNNLPRIERN